jgi:hypothetical protein
MRAAVLTGLLIFAASAACAKPFAIPDSPPSGITLPSQAALDGRYALARARADYSPLLDEYPSRFHYTPSDNGFGIGPIRADGNETVGLGRRGGPKPRYRLEGMSVLGGSVGGTIDGRGAMLALHWGDSH